MYADDRRCQSVAGMEWFGGLARRLAFQNLRTRRLGNPNLRTNPLPQKGTRMMGEAEISFGPIGPRTSLGVAARAEKPWWNSSSAGPTRHRPANFVGGLARPMGQNLPRASRPTQSHASPFIFVPFCGHPGPDLTEPASAEPGPAGNGFREMAGGTRSHESESGSKWIQPDPKHPGVLTTKQQRPQGLRGGGLAWCPRGLVV